MSLLNWFRRGTESRQLLAVSPAVDGISVALTDRAPDGSAVVLWAEYLTLGAGSRVGGEGTSGSGQDALAQASQAADERRSRQERRQADRRQGDRRSGERRSGERRAGQSGNPAGGESVEGEFDHIAPLLHRFVRQRDLRRIPCSGLLRNGDYTLILVDTPDVPPSEIRAAMRWQVKEQIDFHIDDAIIDVFDVPDRDNRASRRMYAVVARRGKVTQLAELMTVAGLNLEVIDIPEMALRNLAARLPEDEGGVAFIAFERGHGLITVTRQGALFFSRRVDCGSERLLAASGEGGLGASLEGLLDGLTIEVQRSLDFYERHFSQSAVSGIVITPVPGVTDEVCRYLEAQLGVRTRWLVMESDCGFSDAAKAAASTGCITAIGAALRNEPLEL